MVETHWPLPPTEHRYEGLTPESLYHFDKARGREFTGPTPEEFMGLDELSMTPEMVAAARKYNQVLEQGQKLRDAIRSGNGANDLITDGAEALNG